MVFREKQILFFYVHFQTCFLDFRRELTEKGLKLTKKFENGSKKVFRQTPTKKQKDPKIEIRPFENTNHLKIGLSEDQIFKGWAIALIIFTVGI